MSSGKSSQYGILEVMKRGSGRNRRADVSDVFIDDYNDLDNFSSKEDKKRSREQDRWAKEKLRRPREQDESGERKRY